MILIEALAACQAELNDEVSKTHYIDNSVVDVSITCNGAPLSGRFKNITLKDDFQNPSDTSASLDDTKTDVDQGVFVCNTPNMRGIINATLVSDEILCKSISAPFTNASTITTIQLERDANNKVKIKSVTTEMSLPDAPHLLIPLPENQRNGLLSAVDQYMLAYIDQFITDYWK